VDVQIGEIHGWAFGSNGEDIRHALTVRKAAVFSTENIRFVIVLLLLLELGNMLVLS
jgi:hypothetical protein